MRDHEDEDPERARARRELTELVNELRLAAPGVQLLLGFLLIAPFNQRFEETTTFERGVYVTSLLLVAVAAILLLGTSIQHRIMFRRRFKRRMLVVISTTALIGLTCLGLGILGSVLLVAHFIWGTTAAIAITVPTGLVLAGIWYALPLWRLNRPDPD